MVIGLSDPEWGRRVHAVVQLVEPGSLDAEQLRTYAKARLSGYKVPKTIEFVDAIPRSEATKVNRAQLVAEREPETAG